MDFFKIRVMTRKDGSKEVYPDFLVKPSKDIMIRGHSFYAIWDEALGRWNRNELRVTEMVDQAIREKCDKIAAEIGDTVYGRFMEDYSSKSWSAFCAYMSSMPDNFHLLDSKITFSNTKVRKEDYTSKNLPYALEPGDHSAFDEMLGILYSPDELEKLLWAIGSIVSGDSVEIQKFIVLYGEPGTGKGTVIDIINMLFGAKKTEDGYTGAIDVEALTTRGDNFATDVFRNNPLVGYQQDADLSKIDKNTTFNSIVSHEVITMKRKYEDSFNAKSNCFIFVGSNDPVRITNGKSGLLRRLIDVTPTGNRIPPAKYKQLKHQIKFELGAIADYCLHFYQERGANYYDAYRPISMQFKTDPFFNFVEYNRLEFEREDGVSLKTAYARYHEYINEGGGTMMQRYKFREELKNYFRNFEDIARVDGKQVRSWFSGFKKEKFTAEGRPPVLIKEDPPELILDRTTSLLDELLKDCLAQYADDEGKPEHKWINCKTTLKDLDTHRLHFLQLPPNYIRVDFDLKDETGKKSREKNLKAAAQWPKTYMEFSKSGAGIHAYYIYTGDVHELSNSYADDIEIKVSTGNSSARRQLTLCNDIPVATITGGLPKKEGRKLLNEERIRSERSLRELIERNLRKEIHPGTKPSIDFIEKILNDAYDSGLKYDISDMRQKILSFAMHSTNQKEYCVKAVGRMKWKSEEPEACSDGPERSIVIFDCEVFPNLLVVCWKYLGPDHNVVKMINPTPDDIDQLCKYRLIGFNCRKYDNHILYARILGKSNEEIYKISQGLIENRKSASFGEAYSLSYTDIYDFASTKQSLKKWEIQLGIHHQELGIPWDQEVPEDRWQEVAEYCVNDVLATEATFMCDDIQADWTARQILADIAGMSVNDTTNSLTARIIFGADKNPQSTFNYRNMGDESTIDKDWFIPMDLAYPEFTQFDRVDNFDGRPVFPGYKKEKGVSTYRGEDVGEGGYVYAEPGVYFNVALLDIASMHPSSIVAENLFGPYTARFKDILDIRVAIKHKEFEKARHMLDGKLARYLTDEKQAKQLSKALKIAINSVYGLTSASFENAFKDPRNTDNIVAKRGALFMVNLKHEVQAKGFTVAHIKTDSIKIPNATPEIISFVMDYGKLYGYTFEHEATMERICLIDDAQYIAQFATPEYCQQTYGYVPEENQKNPEKLTPNPGRWTATGKAFRTTYTFKKLFTHEDIIFGDLSIPMSVTTAFYLDMNENLSNVEDLEKELDRCVKKKGPYKNLSDDEINKTIADLCERIQAGHNYVFVGRVGLFCPMVNGAGGGWLVREKGGAYYAASGTKGTRWMEAEMVKLLEKENLINTGYFDNLMADTARKMEDAAKKTNTTLSAFIEKENAYV